MNPEVKRLSAENSKLRARVRVLETEVAWREKQLMKIGSVMEELFCPICSELASEPVHDEECFK